MIHDQTGRPGVPSDPRLCDRLRIIATGKVPYWLDGILIQNGGGRFEWPNKLRRNLTNAGDGYAKLDVFTFSNGTVTFTSKFARSGWFNKSAEIDDIAPSLAFGKPEPPRLSDRTGLPNVLASNDNLAVNIISMKQKLLMISDQPGSIEFDPDTLEFGKHTSPMPPHSAFTDIPPLPTGMMGAFGSAHPLWTGSSLDSTGDTYGLLNVQRLTTLDRRHEQIRLFKIAAADQAGARAEPSPWLTRRAITTINITEGEFAPYMHSFFLVSKPASTSSTHAVLVQAISESKPNLSVPPVCTSLWRHLSSVAARVTLSALVSTMLSARH